jgi:hypothetical protein
MFQKLKTCIAANRKAKTDKDEHTGRSDKAEGGNLILLEAVATIAVTAIAIAIIAMIAMIVTIKTIIATMMIIETVVMRITVMKRSITSTQIVAMTVIIILMVSEQMTNRQCMLIAASPTLEAVIICLNITLVLPAADQTTDIKCHVVALVVPRVVTLFLTIRWIARMLARTPVSLEMLSLLPIMQQILMKSSSSTMDRR